jgi:hypothetical protein
MTRKLVPAAHSGRWAVHVPEMENAQHEASQALAVIPRFGWDASYWSKEMYRIFALGPDPTPPPYMEIRQRKEKCHFHPFTLYTFGVVPPVRLSFMPNCSNGVNLACAEGWNQQRREHHEA